MVNCDPEGTRHLSPVVLTILSAIVHTSGDWLAGTLLAQGEVHHFDFPEDSLSITHVFHDSLTALCTHWPSCQMVCDCTNCGMLLILEVTPGAYSKHDAQWVS